MNPDIIAQTGTPPTMPFADQLPIVAVIFFIVCVFGLAIWVAAKYVWSEYKLSVAASRAFQAEQNKEQREVLDRITDKLTRAQCESTDAIGEMAREFRAVGQGISVMGSKVDIILEQTRPYGNGGEERRPKPRNGF